MSATTPHTHNMPAQYNSSATPSRRVLGDLTPKAINTPSTRTPAFDSSELARAQSPLKQVTNYAQAPSVNNENLATPNAYFKGKKRGIDEVEAVETVENLKMLARGRDDSIVGAGVRLTADAIQKHTVAKPGTLTRPAHTNQSKENNPIGLADPGSPTERATPTPEPEPIQDSQRSNQSFSDFLNFDQCASQKSEYAAPFEPAPTSTSVLAPAPVIVEKEKKRSRAELLRTRLNFGLYKVKTNQVDKRDAEVISNYEARVSYSSDALNASRSTAMTSSAESLGTPRVPNITISAPRRNQEPTFVKANLDPFRPIGKLGAAPVLFALPQDGTSVSSRMVQKYDLSSSPPDAALPQSVSPDQLISPIRRAYAAPTPSRIRRDEHDTRDIIGGPVTAHQRLQRLKEQQYRESGTTNSVVKDSAAEGLLELMNRQR